MGMQPPLTPEIEQTLSRYLEVQREERLLAEEKERLQEVLKSHLADMKGSYWYPVVGGCALKVRCHREVRIDYNEELLRKRLGSRYVHVLKPDIAKLRRHLSEVASYLTPALELIGSPARERVQEAIQGGLVRQEEFAGAFEKSVRRTIAVMRVKEGEERGGEGPW